MATSCQSIERVFILGAGFSRPAGYPLATKMTDEVLDSIRQLVGKEYELFKFADHVRRLHQWITQSQALPALNIEEFYEYATICAERFRMEQHCITVGRYDGETPYGQAEDIITWLSYLDEHLLDVLLRHEESAHMSAIERFVAELHPGDAIITFNYDRLIERCLRQKDMPLWFGMDDEQHSGALPVFKMHGSLDWICFAREQQVAPGANIHRLFSKENVNLNSGDNPTIRSGEHEYDYELYRVSDDSRLRNLIEHKSLIQYDHYWGLAGLGPRKRPSRVPGLGIVWKHALRALYAADHIVVIGFAFSPFDRFIQIEFARVAAGREENGKPPPKVTVIDPSLIAKSGVLPRGGCELLQRIEAVFRSATPVGKHHQDFDWSNLS